MNELVPIIFLTGQTEKYDRIRGLSLGADDYVTKPFSMEELALRIQNILKRVRVEQSSRQKMARYEIGQFAFDATAHELVWDGQASKLTAIESKLLQLFAEHINEVVERDLALKRIWGDDEMLHGRSLNVYISKLRQLLKSDPAIEIINVHGVGYRMIIKDAPSLP